jgi:hypothetical protein
VKEKILKIGLYSTSIIALFAFLAVRILPLFNFVMVEKKNPEYFEFTKYGEQYYSCYIDHFKENLPKAVDKYRLSDRNPPLKDADIIAFGDSFFDFSRQKTVAERLHDSLSLSVHSEAGFLETKDWYPLYYLNENKYQSDKKRILIYEVVERNIHDRFVLPHQLFNNEKQKVEKPVSLIFKKTRDFIFNSNSEKLFTVLLQGSYLTNWIYCKIATLKFDLFGYISARTPIYSLDEFQVPMLFYDITVNDKPTGFYFNHTDEMIKTYCDNISDLSEKLMDNYNLKLIFVPVPNKYTIYHEKMKPGSDYSNFLPRLYLVLDSQRINYINLFDDYKSSDSLLYYGTDAHWNKNGVDIAVDKILQELRNDPIIMNLTKKE